MWYFLINKKNPNELLSFVEHVSFDLIYAIIKVSMFVQHLKGFLILPPPGRLITQSGM